MPAHAASWQHAVHMQAHCLLLLAQVCLMALGHCSHEHYPVLFEELPSLIDEYTRTKQRRGTSGRPEEVGASGQAGAAATHRFACL